MNPSPLERYQRDLERSDFHRDPAQAMAVDLLQKLYETLIAHHAKQESRGLLSLLNRYFSKQEPEPV